MMQNRHAKSFRDLIVYQKSKAVSRLIFTMSKSFPKEETYSLTDQIRRSARSIGAQIAEAWGKRRYKKHFISKLTDADAEQLETQHWVDEAASCKYITKGQEKELIEQLSEIGRMLNSMMNKADKFCRPEKSSDQ
jgi:four helix bundle protein